MHFNMLGGLENTGERINLEIPAAPTNRTDLGH
jgi:hypothetical protein